MSLDKPKSLMSDASKHAFAIVASRFNNELVDALLNDALAVLRKAKAADIRVERVPGAGEIPYAAKMLAYTGKYDAVICLGVVIRGDTPHHEIIAHSTANALQSLALDSEIPMINGIIVTNDLAQAQARTIGAIRRGPEFAEAAIEMAHYCTKLGTELDGIDGLEFGENDLDGGFKCDFDDDSDDDFGKIKNKKK